MPRVAHRRRTRPNLFGFGKRVTHSAKLLDKAFDEGKRTGDTGRFKDWFADQQERDQKFSGSLKRRAQQAFRRGVEKHGEPSSGSGSKGIKADLFKARATIKDIAFDQGYNDEKQDRDRNLSSDEILDYISGQRDASGWESAMGKIRIASLYKHEYRQGQKKARAEGKKEAKGEASSVVKEVTEALIAQGMKRAHAVSKAKGAFKTGQSFEETFRKAVAGSGKTSKMSANPSVLEKRLDILLNRARDRKRLDEMQREMLKDKHSAKYRRLSKQYMKDVREIERLQKQYREVHGIANPAKFDKCVTEVQASLKKYGRPGNAYAICTAAGTRNPESPAQLKAKGWHLVDRYATRAAAEGVSQKYTPYRLILRSGKWEVWTRQKTAVVNASARARSKASSDARHQRKAPTTKGKANPVVWSARQGNLKAEIRKSLMGPYKLRIMGGARVLEEYSPKKFDEAVAIARLRLAESRLHNPKATTADLIPGGSSALKGVDKSLDAWKGVVKRVTRGISRPFRASKSRKNPMDLALKRYEEFHGVPSEEILQFEEKEHYHSAKVGLGQLVSILVTLINGKTVPLNSPGFTEKGLNGRKYWEFDNKTPIVKRVYLTSSEDGKQLFIDGGDQSIPTEALRDLGITASDEHDHMLIGTIRMVTYRTRKSFEGKGKEEIDFHHTFGSEGSKGVAPVLLYFPRSQKLKMAGGRYAIAAPERDLGNVSPGIVG